jgi:FkbM family methyltransferase
VSVFIHQRFEQIFQREPLVLVDVGARGGLRPNWRAAQPHLKTIGFEPEADEFERLNRQTGADGMTVFFHAALHKRAESLVLHIARDRGLTSIFAPNRPFLDSFPEAERFDTVATAEMTTDTMDHVLHTGGIGDVDFVKVDTQGSELFILQGGEKTLRRSVVGVEVEVEFAPVYKNQPLFADVDAYLRSLGFSLFDLRPCYWKRADGRTVGGPQGQLIWADALYLREVTALPELLSKLEPARRPAKLLKSLSVSILYGYFDYALAILAAAGSVLSADDQRVAREAVLSAGKEHDPMPTFPGRTHVARAARRLWKLSAERNHAWSISDAELGNPR